MRQLTKRSSRTEGDKGIVLVWFALMATIFLGIGAIVVDYSLLLSERQQLQNGADAGALAIAAGCAVSSCGSPSTIAAQYASLNAADGVSSSTVCGKGSGLTACSSVPSGTTGALGYAKVSTTTLNTDGSDRVNFILGPFLNAFRSNGPLLATSTTAWGVSSTATATSFALSMCSFNSSWVSADGTLNLPSSPVLIRVTATTCDGNSVNGFEYLLPNSAGTCQNDLVATGPTLTVQATTGASAACRQTILDAYNADKAILVPLFSKKYNNTLTVTGFASFQPCGFWISGNTKIYNKCPNLSLCATTQSNSNQRICGWFRAATVEGGNIGSTTDYGVRTIKVVG